jgi:FAD dependent oxidoreductase
MIVSRRSTAPSASPDPLAPSLAGGARVEACVAGAGLAGMIGGYLLARARRSVMVLDEGVVCDAPAGAGTLQLAALLEHPYRVIEQRAGREAARLAAQGFSAAVDAIEAIVRRERLACEFERLDGYCLGSTGASTAELAHEIEAAARAGVELEWLAAPPIEAAPSAPCVRYPGQALLDPRKLAAGLARAIVHEGGRIHGRALLRAIESGPTTTLVTGGGHRVQAEVVVSPCPNPAAATRAVAQGVAMRVPRGAVTRALYWDGTGERCAALRAHGLRASEVLLVAGRDPHAGLERWAREHFPCAGEVVQRFCVELLETPRLFAFAGRAVADCDSAYASDGEWATPLTRAALAGLAIRDVVEGPRAPWAQERVQPGAVPA